LRSDIPCNKDSTDDNGGGGCGLELLVRDDDGSVTFDEINVGLERARRKKKQNVM
jgi:hypothetical protein